MEDFSKLSDEELDAIISGKSPATAETPDPLKMALAGAKDRIASEKAAPDNTQGMSDWDLALAGIGGEMNAIGQGLKEKAQIAFRPEGVAGEQTLKDVAARRAERKAVDEKLYSNPAAQAGKFAATAIPAIATPARLPAQMALEGVQSFAKAGSEKPEGLYGELAGSAAHAGLGAATVGALGKGQQLLGKTLGAGLGRMTPEGEAALHVKDAALRLGLELG